MRQIHAVYCPGCDVTAYYPSKDAAKQGAQLHEFAHRRTVLIYDVDAGHLAPEELGRI